MNTCGPDEQFCMLSDQTLVWMDHSFETCELVGGNVVQAERRGNNLISHEGNFAVTLNGRKRVVCKIQILDTHEGLMLNLQPAKGRSHTLRAEILTDYINKTTTELATVAYVEKYLENLIQVSFQTSYIQICNIQRSRYHFLRTLAITQPTLAARALLQTSHISARLAGQYFMIWNCLEISDYQLRIVSECYEEIPILYRINGHQYEAFLSLNDLEIMPKARPKKCNLITPQYAGITSTHVWDGRNLTYIKLHTTDIILLSAMPKLTNYHLQLYASKIHDPYKDHIDRLTRLLDVERSIQALARLFEMTATDVDISPEDIRDLAASAGINSVNFVKSALKSTLNALLPSSAWFYLLLTTVVIITALVIWGMCFAYARKYCKCIKDVCHKKQTYAIEHDELQELQARVNDNENDNINIDVMVEDVPLPPPPAVNGLEVIYEE